MKFYSFLWLKVRPVFLLFVGLTITIVLLLGSGHQLSWAAPNQNPRMQTVPPRPTPDSEAHSQNDNGDDDDADTPLPARSAGEAGEQQPAKIDQPVSSEAVGEGKAALATPQPQSTLQKQSKPPAPSSNQANKAGEGQIAPQHADLNLSHSASNLTPYAGETITLTTVISNRGPSRATNVIVKNPLPPGLVLSSTLASRGHYQADQGLWIIDTIGRSEQVTVSLVVNVTGVDPIKAVSEVASADQLDPDSIAHNDLEIEDDQASVSVTLSDETALDAPSRSDLPGTTSLPIQETSAPASEAYSLYWLYALILGIALTFMGLQLVRRS